MAFGNYHNFSDADWQNLYNSDPQYRALVSAPHTSFTGSGGNAARQDQIRAYLKQKGIPATLPGGSAIRQDGRYVHDATGLEAFLQYGLPSLLAFTGGGIAAGGAGGAAGGAGYAGQAVSDVANASEGAVAAGEAGAAGAGVLPSTQVGNGMLSTAPGGAPSGAMSAGSGGIFSQVGKYLTSGKIADILKAGGGAIGAAAEAATQRRLASEGAFDARARLEDQERNGVVKDLYRASVVKNPHFSPYDPNPPSLPSDSSYRQGLNQLEQTGLARLPKLNQYGVETLPDVKPSGLETAGTWASPIMTGIGTAADILRGKTSAGTPPIVDPGMSLPGGGKLTLTDQILKYLKSGQNQGWLSDLGGLF